MKKFFHRQVLLVVCNVVLAVFLHAFTGAIAQTTLKRALLALSKAEHTLSIVDPISLKVVARIPVGTDPHEVVASTDGKTAYVAIYGGGAFHELSVVDLVAYKALPAIDTRPLFGPHDVIYVDNKVWFTAEGSKAVGRYNPATATIEWSMGTGQDRTHMIFVTPDSKKIYTTNITSGTVSILENTSTRLGGAAKMNTSQREDWSHTVIPTMRGSEGFDLSPDGNELWTASAEDGSISIIDLASRKLVSKVDAKATGANRLKFTPDGKQVFISSLRSGELSIFDTKSHAEVKRLKIGNGAAGILMDPEGSRAFVACSPDNFIAIIDLKTLTVTGKLEVGGIPDGLAWAVRQ